MSVIIDKSKCVGCGLCIEVCPARALFNRGGKTEFNQSKCTVCGICDRICIVSALEFHR